MTMTISTTPTDDDVADLTEADIAALQLALDLTLADDPPDSGRVEQITDMLTDPEYLYGNIWRDVADLAVYHQQMERLHMLPWQGPPCWIITEAEADAILVKGPVLSVTGNGEDIGDCKCARLLKRMLRHDVSPYHPDPVKAIRAAQRSAKVVKMRP
jgi:hypothetical protein